MRDNSHPCFCLVLPPTLHLSRPDWCSGLYNPMEWALQGTRFSDVHQISMHCCTLGSCIDETFGPFPLIVAIRWRRSVLGFRFQNNWNFLFFKKEKKKYAVWSVFCCCISAHIYTVHSHTMVIFILPVEASLYTIKIKYLVVFKIVQKK